MAEELDSSELGTQEYWDERYKMEINNFRNHGDPGEVWFDEDSIDRIVNWMNKSSLIDKNDKILDIGCGNGYDYSNDAILLAKEIANKHVCNIKYEVKDILAPITSPFEKFKIVHDKGTYDAISLSENSKDNRTTYIENVYSILDDNGLYIITSCNWTQDELLGQFNKLFHLNSAIPTPEFKFGGKVGNVVTSLVLEKRKI